MYTPQIATHQPELLSATRYRSALHSLIQRLFDELSLYTPLSDPTAVESATLPTIGSASGCYMYVSRACA
jgi:hypothetical protein